MDDRKQESYTVMILPNPTSKAYRFSVTKKQVKVALSITAATAILLLVFVVQYFYMVGNIWELTLLRKETAVQKSKIEHFAQSVDGLKQQMDRLKEFDIKLRMITDLNVPADAGRFLGIGGQPEVEAADSPGTSAVQEPIPAALTAPPIQSPAPSGEGGTEDPIPSISLTDVPREPHAAIIRGLEDDLTTLQIVAAKQEQSFQELTEAMNHRRAKWASTPSIWPVRGWVTSGFGRRLSPFTGEPAMHRGVDISVPAGTPIVAPANGTVTSAGWDGGLGNAIKITHGYGYETIYGHLNKILVRKGQWVKRGQTIGLVGSTGFSTGPHLHYQVQVNLVATNPLRYILN
jgi:murein DD-endopeptidase MepM/ murein hydrolase activator NlpD